MLLSDEHSAQEMRELTARLAALEEGDRYRVERTLSDSGYEITQVVYRKGELHPRPLVRKIFTADSCCGQAYSSIYQAQVGGIRFAHQPHIYEFDQTDERTVVVMEYVQGKTLAELVQREGPSAELAMKVGISLCEALVELHEGVNPPVIHRDVKPCNIVMDGDRLVLVDFGIARELRPEARCDTVRFGTPGYAPPEQFGYRQTDMRSDVYAAGMVIAYCLTGDNDNEALRDLGFQSGGIPASLRNVLVKATEFDPKMRYATARDMLSDLQRIDTRIRSVEAAFQQRSPSNCAGTPTVQSFTVPKDLQRPLHWEPRSKLVLKLCRAWNALVVFAWALMFLLVVSVVISPTGAVAQYALWYRAFAYLHFILIPLALCGYAVMYKGDIRKHAHFLWRFNWKTEIPLCVMTSIISIVLAVAVGVATGQVA